MHIKTQTNLLNSAIKDVSTFVTTSEGIANIVISTDKKGFISIEAASEGTYAQSRCMGECVEDGSVCVDGRLLTSLKVKGNIDLRSSGSRLDVKVGSTKASFETNDMPGDIKLYRKKPSSFVKLEASDFLEWTSKVRIASAHSQYALTNIIIGKNKNVSIVTADSRVFGSALLSKKYDWATKKLNILLYATLFCDLSRILSEKGKVKVAIDQAAIHILHNKARLRIPSHDIDFPKVKKFIEKTMTEKPTVAFSSDVNDLKEALDIVSSSGDSNADILWTVEGKKATLKLDAQRATITHKMSVEAKTKKKVQFKVRSSSMKDLFQIISGESVSVKVYNDALLIVVDDGEVIYEVSREEDK